MVVAGDGQQAVDMVAAPAPDLVLLDMNLPVLDGRTVAGLIKSSPTTSAIPVIALTANVMSGDMERVMAAGCDDHHPKPIEFARLVTRIETLTSARGAAHRG